MFPIQLFDDATISKIVILGLTGLSVLDVVNFLHRFYKAFAIAWFVGFFYRNTLCAAGNVVSFVGSAIYLVFFSTGLGFHGGFSEYLANPAAVRIPLYAAMGMALISLGGLFEIIGRFTRASRSMTIETRR